MIKLYCSDYPGLGDTTAMTDEIIYIGQNLRLASNKFLYKHTNDRQALTFFIWKIIGAIPRFTIGAHITPAAP